MKFYRRVFESFFDREKKKKEVGILTVLHVSLADVAAAVSEVNYTSANCPFQPSVSGFPSDGESIPAVPRCVPH